MAVPPATRRRTVTRGEVIDATLEILDTEGRAGLTMANVAGRVGFTTMAVYRHVKNREDLIAGAVEVVLREIVEERSEGDDGEPPWLDAVQGWMDDVRTALLAHPWAANELGTRQEGAGVPWRNTLQILGRHVHRSPLLPHDQARALAWTARLTVGVLILELSSPIRGAPPPPATGSPLVKELATLSDDDLWADAVAQTRAFLSSMAPTSTPR